MALWYYTALAQHIIIKSQNRCITLFVRRPDSMGCPFMAATWMEPQPETYAISTGLKQSPVYVFPYQNAYWYLILGEGNLK